MDVGVVNAFHIIDLNRAATGPYGKFNGPIGKFGPLREIKMARPYEIVTKIFE